MCTQRNWHVKARAQWQLTGNSAAQRIGVVCVLALCATLTMEVTAADYPAIPAPDLTLPAQTAASTSALRESGNTLPRVGPRTPCLVPLTSRDLRIAQPVHGLPANVAVDCFAEARSLDRGTGVDRRWSPSGFAWQASVLHYRPLYFQDVALERYGRSFGMLQPAVSTAHAFGRFLTLPLLMIIHPPYQQTYSLGYSRPGS